MGGLHAIGENRRRTCGAGRQAMGKQRVVEPDALTSCGGIIPTAQLRWHQGLNHFMAYVTGDIFADDYNPMRLANLGVGHGVIGSGSAYTYLNPTTGNELSATAGFTYNFENPDTQHCSDIDFHFDWGASYFLSKQLYAAVPTLMFREDDRNDLEARASTVGNTDRRKSGNIFVAIDRHVSAVPIGQYRFMV